MDTSIVLVIIVRIKWLLQSPKAVVLKHGVCGEECNTVKTQLVVVEAVQMLKQ